LIVGRDAQSHSWRYNYGTWEWSTWLITNADSRYKWTDDAFGPYNDGSGYSTWYFVFRQWYDSSHWSADEVDNYSYKVQRMGIKYYDQIYTRYGRDYNRYGMQKFLHNYGSTSQCNYNSGQLPCINRRSVRSQWSGTEFF